MRLRDLFGNVVWLWVVYRLLDVVHHALRHLLYGYRRAADTPRAHWSGTDRPRVGELLGAPGCRLALTSLVQEPTCRYYLVQTSDVYILRVDVWR